MYSGTDFLGALACLRYKCPRVGSCISNMLIAPVVFKVAENLNWQQHLSLSVYKIAIGMTIRRQWWTDEAVSARYGTKVATKSGFYFEVSSIANYLCSSAY